MASHNGIVVFVIFGIVIFIWDGSKKVCFELDVGKTKNDVKSENLEIEPDSEPLQVFHLSATAVYDKRIISYFSNLIYFNKTLSLCCIGLYGTI